MLCATVTGGVTIARSGHVLRLTASILGALNDGQPVWVRDTAQPLIIVRIDPHDHAVVATNCFDEPRPLPSWASDLHTIIHQ